MSDLDVVDFLKTWGLEQYTNIFKENNVTMKALAVMTPDIVKEMIPNAGDRSILLHNLREWRAIFENAVTEEIYQKADLSAFHAEVPFYVNVPLDSGSSDAGLVALETSEPSSSEGRHQPIPSEVELLLKRTPSGRALIQQYGETGLLDHRARRRLCHLIVDNELADDPEKKIPSSRFHSLAYEITTVFKEEHLATYFVPYVSFGPGLRRLAKGKLLDCVNNKRKSLRAAGVITSSRRSRDSPSTSRSSTPSRFPPGLAGLENDSVLENEIVEESVQWLRNSTDPWQVVESHWDRTTYYRLLKLTKDGSTISQYFQDYPALKKPSGYLLILKDFQVAYPAAINKLYERLPLFKQKIYGLAKKRILICKDEIEKKQLDSFISCEEEAEDTSNLGCILCLPYLVSVTTLRKKKGTWRPSRVETRESLITVVAAENLVQETVTRRQSKLQGMGLTLQPFIIAVGASLSEIKTYFVIVDDVRYQLPTCLAAVDCCFKIIIQLNAEYPTESSVIWAFIQEGLYEIITQYDKKYIAVSTLMSEIGI